VQAEKFSSVFSRLKEKTDMTERDDKVLRFPPRLSRTGCNALNSASSSGG